jgi:hypothetical protein
MRSRFFGQGAVTFDTKGKQLDVSDRDSCVIVGNVVYLVWSRIM